MYENIWKWIIVNKEWFFDGLGVVIISGIIAWLLKRSNDKPSQSIKSGKGSINIQSQKDVNIEGRSGKDEQ